VSRATLYERIRAGEIRAQKDVTCRLSSDLISLEDGSFWVRC
jgi:hypothetical protein